MRILITNDDGYSARGIEILATAVEAMGAEPWIVAPQQDRSGVSHAMTLSEPMSVRKFAPNGYALSGTPADCVAFAFSELFSDDNPPDAVLSGINHGSNVSDEMVCSGTVAGARAGAFRGVRSIAISQVFRGKQSLHDIDATPVNCDQLVSIIKPTLERSWSSNVFFNINLPDYPTANVTHSRAGEALVTRLHQRRLYEGRFEKRTSPRGTEYYWYGSEYAPSSHDNEITESNAQQSGNLDLLTDIEAVEAGAVSITALPLYPPAITEAEELTRLAKEIRLPL